MDQRNRSGQPDAMLLACFVEEAAEHLQAFSDAVLALEQDPRDGAAINAAFRAMHTIKGVAGSLGFADIGRLAHAAEHLLDLLRQGVRKADPELCDALLSAGDALSCLIQRIREPDSPAPDTAALNELVGRLEALANKTPAQDSSRPDCSVSGPDIPDDLLQEFVTEASEQLASLEPLLVDLEQNLGETSLLDAVFRSIHNIKGAANYVGLDSISRLAHAIESVLDAARKGRLRMDPAVFDRVLAGIDSLRGLIEALPELRPLPEELVRRLNDLVPACPRGSAAGSREAPQAPQDPLVTFVQFASQQIECLAACYKKIKSGCADESVLAAMERAARTLQAAARSQNHDAFLHPLDQLADLASLARQGKIEFDDLMLSLADEALDKIAAVLADLSASLPSADSAERVGEILVERGAVRDEQVTEALAKQKQKKLGQILRDKGAVDVADVASAVADQSKQRVAAAAEVRKTVRVDEAKLDAYMALVEELVIARNALKHALKGLHGADSATARSISDAVANLDRLCAALQENAMSMRMVPAKVLFQRFPRIVRDVARSTGKKITLQMLGEDTELDKQIIESLADPLVHLVRNAADHGIEPPEQRVAAGKPETGQIVLSAEQRDNGIVITVRDDGAGIDKARVLAKALEKGLVRPEEAESLTDQQIYELLFRPGFSTAEKVSEISGRGVGMDVVKTNVAALNGSVRIDSEPGRGTTVEIRVPLTLAVTTVVLIEVAGRLYAVPTAAVRETLKVPTSSMVETPSGRVISLRGHVVPVFDCAELLGLRTGGFREKCAGGVGATSLLVVNSAFGEMALTVDRLLRQEEIVLKPLPAHLVASPGLAGATIMGDGSVVLVVDPAKLVAAGLKTAGAASNEALHGGVLSHPAREEPAGAGAASRG